VLIVALVATAVIGVAQLHVLGSLSRSIRFRVAVAAIGAGAYGAGALSLGLEVAYTRVLAWLTGGLLTEVVEKASYTVDPVIEEVVKIAPLMAAGWLLQARRKWGLTDHLIVGAASGAGFGVMEALARFGTTSSGATRLPQGWLFPTSLAPPFVPSIPLALRSWLPAPISQEPLGVPDSPDVFKHLVWSALAGLGVGLWYRAPRRWRWAGPALVLLVAGDHAALNYQAATSGLDDGSAIGNTLAWPFTIAEGLLGWWPVLALVVAVTSDRRAVLTALGDHPRLRMMAGTRRRQTEVVCLTGYGLMRPPWTVAVVHRYVLVRRSAAYAHTADWVAGAESVEQATRIRALMARAATREAWRGIRPARSLLAEIRATAGSRPFRFSLRVLVPLVIWTGLAAPVLLFYRATEDGRLLGLQGEFLSGAAYTLTKVALFVGLAWTAWRIYRMLQAFGLARRLAFVDDAARLWFTLCTTVGSTGLGLVMARAVAGGAEGDDRVISNNHFLDSWASLFLVAGILLIVAAVVLSLVIAPAVGFAGLYASESLLFGAVGLGLTGTALFQASSSGGTATGLGPGISLGPGSDPSPPNPFEPGPWFPWFVAATATVDHLANNATILGDPAADPEAIDPHQYVDGKGDLRWRDTNERVADNPSRSRYQDDNGTWRWADTDQPVDGGVSGQQRRQRRRAPRAVLLPR
jgi:hypothetical protein